MRKGRFAMLVVETNQWSIHLRGLVEMASDVIYKPIGELYIRLMHRGAQP